MLAWSEDATLIKMEGAAAYSDDFAVFMIKMYTNQEYGRLLTQQNVLADVQMSVCLHCHMGSISGVVNEATRWTSLC